MNNYDERSIGVILEKIEASHEILKEVKLQVEKTNGRVQSLEKWRVGLSVGIAITATMGITNVSSVLKILSGI